MAMIRVVISLESPLWRECKALAEKQECSASEVARRAIAAYIVADAQMMARLGAVATLKSQQTVRKSSATGE